MALAVLAAPVAVLASPITTGGSDNVAISGSDTVSSSDTSEDGGFFSLQLGDRTLGHTDDSLLGVAPADLKVDLTVSGLPFGTLQLQIGTPTPAGVAAAGSLAHGGVTFGAAVSEEMTPNPEPASMLLIGTGLAALAAGRKRASARA